LHATLHAVQPIHIDVSVKKPFGGAVPPRPRPPSSWCRAEFERRIRDGETLALPATDRHWHKVRTRRFLREQLESAGTTS
jgi:hypothetical protein